jgi:subtilase family serine protease
LTYTTYYDEYRLGGTSLSSPLYAGIWALGLANPVLYAVQGLTYDITKAQLPTYPGAVRADYVNGVDGSRGYSYTARWFDRTTR